MAVGMALIVVFSGCFCLSCAEGVDMTYPSDGPGVTQDPLSSDGTRGLLVGVCDPRCTFVCCAVLCLGEGFFCCVRLSHHHLVVDPQAASPASFFTVRPPRLMRCKHTYLLTCWCCTPLSFPFPSHYPPISLNSPHFPFIAGVMPR